jgi:hypothetical protein
MMDEHGSSGASEWGRTTDLLITNSLKSRAPIEFQALRDAESGRG